jgi:hypothetical protein
MYLKYVCNLVEVCRLIQEWALEIFLINGTVVNAEDHEHLTSVLYGQPIHNFSTTLAHHHV